MCEAEGAGVQAQIVLYQQDGRNVPVEVTYEDETFWLSQKKIYASGELSEKATRQDFLQVRNEAV